MESGWSDNLWNSMEVTKLGVPMLMVNGSFRNLSSMTVEELETFIPFMTGCSLEKIGPSSVKGGAPQWWSPIIKYKFPLKKPKGLSDLGYRRHLQSMVCKCYCYHDAHFLLSFSSKFSQQPQSIFLKSNGNNTTSVFCVENVSEMFTFDNENKDYDSKTRIRTNRKSLMPVHQNKSNPQITDIYLCENCDVEFYTQTDMQKHEKECYGTTLDDPSDEIQVITHIKPLSNLATDKHGFLDYFGLLSKSEQQQKLHLGNKKVEAEAPVKRWVVLNMCLHKNRKIEFSSLLGRKMLEHRVQKDVMTCLDKSILSVEANCDKGPRTRVFDMREGPKPRITYKNHRKRVWSHSYCFTKKEKREKLKTLRTGG